MKRPANPFEDELGKAARSFPPSEGACIAPERLALFYAGGLDEPESENLREHLSACAVCVATAADARGFADAMRGWNGETATRRLAVRGRWWLAAAAGAAAVAVGLFFYRSAGPPLEDPAARWRGLEIAAAPYALGAPDDGLRWRGGALNDPRGWFARGMAAYAAGDLPEAARLLAGAVEEAPGHEAPHFYLGVTLLLLDRPGEALDHLESASINRAFPLHDEALWYLALGCLKAGREDRGVETLQAIVAGAGAHSEEAGALLRRVRSYGGSPGAPRDP